MKPKYVISSCNDLEILKIRYAESEDELKQIIYNLISKELRHYGVEDKVIAKTLPDPDTLYSEETNLHYRSKIYTIDLNGKGYDYEIQAFGIAKNDTHICHYLLKYDLIPDTDSEI